MALYIALYEDTRFCTFIGGPIETLTKAQNQISALAKSIDAEAVLVDGVKGYRYNRPSGTVCALIITDEWKHPISYIEFEEESY